MRELAVFSVLGLFLLACGGSEQPPEHPPQPEPVSPTVEAVPAPSAPVPAPDAEAPKEEPEAKPAAPEPQFTDGMSVEEATKAVPQGAERANIDSETLGKPLQDFALYEPCKPGSAKVKVKIAVWDGKPVGIDVTPTPKNDKLAACIKDRLKGLSWPAKVKSLNSVEYAF